MESHNLHKLAVDSAAAAASFTAPLWLQAVQTGGQFILTLAGIILLIVRLWIAAHDLRRSWKRKHIAARVNAIISKQNED